MSLLLFTSGNRPATCAHAPLPPFDPSDQYGTVHTSPADGQDFSKLVMKADFCGVTLDPRRWGVPPYVNGAKTDNGAPSTMLMTPMLILYPRQWQDACLTEHAERGYTDLVIAAGAGDWNQPENGFQLTAQRFIEWARYVQSWGFRVVGWRGDPRADDPPLAALLDAGVLDWYIHGEEVDRRMPSQEFEASLQAVDRQIGGKIPIGVHFTADGSRHMGYPIGWPRDDFMRNWSLYDGRVHLMWQGDPYSTAGLMGTSIAYYARRHVNAGEGDAALGPGAPHSYVIAFELRATAQFQGRMTEEQGNLTTWEVLCAPSPDRSRIGPIAGFANGCRYPSGEPL